MKEKTKYIIWLKLNPFDKWKPYKKFSDLNKANRSLETLRKHTYNLFKGSSYSQYCLFAKGMENFESLKI